MLNLLPWILWFFTLTFVLAVSFDLNKKRKSLLEKDKEIEIIKKDLGHLSLDNARLSQSLAEAEKKVNKDLDLEHENQLKSDFVSIASHELRTPMTAIRSYAWMALYKSDVVLSEKLKKYLVRILISTERLINLVNDLLNVSRIEAAKIAIAPESVDLISLTKDVLDEVYYSKSRDKEINMRVLEKPIPKVFADPEKLREVMLNLVGNAVKFTPSGGSVLVDFFSDGETVETLIKDSGSGISKEDISRLFKKFSKLDDSLVVNTAPIGTGLGLYISKSLIELMHGKIWASSEGLNKGATFTFSLPSATNEVLRHAEDYTLKGKEDTKELEHFDFGVK